MIFLANFTNDYFGKIPLQKRVIVAEDYDKLIDMCDITVYAIETATPYRIDEYDVMEVDYDGIAGIHEN
jgi:hypothetical protein